MNYRTQPIIKAKEIAEAQRLDIYGPLPVNIFKELRLQHGFTIKDIESQVFISKSAVIRLEQGIYDQPLPSVLEWWAKHTCNDRRCPSNLGLNQGRPLGELRIRDAYARYQNETRVHYSWLFGDSLELSGAEELQMGTGIHPFRILRSRANFNVAETSKALCMPAATIEHFEKKFRSQQTVPKNLRSALITLGYRHYDLDCLADSYQNFRNLMTGAVRYA